MRQQGVIVLDDYRGDRPSDIQLLMSQVWPLNRKRGDFRDVIRAQAEAELRVTICAFCGTESPPLDGPTGRFWFAAHNCPPEVVA